MKTIQFLWDVQFVTSSMYRTHGTFFLWRLSKIISVLHSQHLWNKCGYRQPFCILEMCALAWCPKGCDESIQVPCMLVSWYSHPKNIFISILVVPFSCFSAWKKAMFWVHKNSKWFHSHEGRMLTAVYFAYYNSEWRDYWFD